MEPAPQSHRQQQQQRALASSTSRGVASAHASPAARRAAAATFGGGGGIYGSRHRENGGVYRSGHVTSAGGSASAAAISSLGKEESLEAACFGPPKFVTDTSPMWYLPEASRDDAIQYLRHLPPGRFIVRDSHSYPGGYGLAVKVAEVPKGAPVRSEDRDTELVRHFLIEPTSKGVRLKGCPNEPVFASLAALIYQHTVTQLALPCKLVLPPMPGSATSHQQHQQPADLVSGMDPLQILAQGAACNVLYLGAVDLESLSGAAGIAKAVDVILRCRDRLRTAPCQFKVARDGITITDTERKLFFRKHFPTACITHCGLDPHNRLIFGFIARKSSSGSDNTGVIVTEIEDYQPAEAVIQFVCNYLIGGRGTIG
uniref:SH2 domain-containing protein n=1 Tax=Macrostomum lignano TaxID=282301 RepID=A0A1I8HP01_9PLAT